MPLAKIFNEKKEETGLSAYKIAAMTDVSENTVVNIIGGRSRSPSVYNVGPICRVLGISLDEFFGITVKGMDQHEIDRVNTGYEKHREELQATLDLYAQQSGHQDEVIARQDARILELNDRVTYMKTAVKWLRILIGCLAAVLVLAVIVIIMLLQLVFSTILL